MTEKHHISIDLGAQNTGLLLDTGDSANNRRGALLRLAKNQQQWSQEPRRGARHLQRGHKRRQLAKRLLRSLIQRNGGAITRKDSEFLGGIVNRRGFTYISLESSEQIEENRDLFERKHDTILHHLASDVFADNQSIENAFTRALDGFVEKTKNIFESSALPPKKGGKETPMQTKAAAFLNTLDKEEKREQERLYKAARKLWDSMGRKETGHLPRRQYLKNIEKDITARAEKGDSFAALLKNAEISAAQFAQAAGHVANLPLRVLRKYFKNMDAAENEWDGKRMAELTTAEARGWRCETAEEKENRKNYLAALEEKKDALQAWLDIPPDKTVPPFENQGNRNPPKCMSLLIKSELLKTGALRRVADALSAEHPELDDGLGDGGRQLSAESPSAKARVLQRALDCSTARDPYQIRRLSQRRHPASEDEELRQAKRKLKNLPNTDGDDADLFLDFAKRYYEESQKGASGAWYCHHNSVLRRCDKNPPHAERMRDVHIARALGCDKSEAATIAPWIQSPEAKAKTGGRGRGLLAICEKAHKLQKKYANEMKALRGENKEVDEIYKHSEAAADAIGEFLEHDESGKKRYADPFVMAQLYRHIKGAAGFSSACRVCSHDNAWRAFMDYSDKGERTARAKSLPTDSIRPFDGMLRRILEAQAQEIANLQMEKLREENHDGGQIVVAICVEQNAFAFAKDLHEIKKSKSTTKFNDKIKKFGEVASGKKERLCKNRHCPYTGEEISDYQTDHIIPRAACRHSGGSAAFNNEANLIGCSIGGNRDKGTETYSLQNLHKKYLREVFDGTSDIATIEARIRQNVEPLLAKNHHPSFVELCKDDPEAAKCLRHGLFVDGLREQIVRRILSTERMARVNGTQRFLAKKIWEFLDDMFRAEKWEKPQRELIRVNARDVFAARMMLPDSWHKPEADNAPQGAMSHVADAAIARILSSENADFSEAVFNKWMPEYVKIRHLEKRAPWDGGGRGKGKDNAAARYKIFGDTIYGEHFLPLLITADGKCIAGFAPDNGVEIEKEPKKWLNTLNPFLSPSFAGKPLAELQKSAEKDSRGYLCMSINKQRAMQAMLDWWRTQEEKEGDNDALRCLRALYYVTIRKSVKAAVWNDRQNTMRARNDILKQDSFMINVTLPPFDGKSKSDGKVCLRSKKHWEQIADALSDKLGKKLPENENINLIIESVTQEICAPRTPKNREHYRRRVVRSLQVLRKPSGAWRIRRRTPDGHVFQLLSVEDFAYKGFIGRDDGKAEFGDDSRAPLAELLNSQFLTPSRPTSKSTSVVSFGEWRDVETPKNSPIKKMSVAVGTKYAQAKAELPLKDFLKITKKINGEWNEAHKIPPEFSIKEKEKDAALYGALFPSLSDKKSGKNEKGRSAASAESESKGYAPLIPLVQVRVISPNGVAIKFRAGGRLKTDLQNRFNQ